MDHCEVPPPAAPAKAFSTRGGEPYRALYEFRQDARDEEGLRIAYSRFKLGDHEALDRFATHLFSAITNSIGHDLEADPGMWLVVSPGHPRIPNAAHLLAARVAERFQLAHFSLQAPLKRKKLWRNRLMGVARGTSWFLAEQRPVSGITGVRERHVVFIDDAVLTGSVLTMNLSYLKRTGAQRVEPFVVAHMDGDAVSFEGHVNAQALSIYGVRLLNILLNSRQHHLVTRLLYHSMMLDHDQFSWLVDSLPDETLIELYLSAIGYFGNEVPTSLNEICRKLEERAGLQLPTVEAFRRVRSEVVFDNVLDLASPRNRLSLEEWAPKVRDALTKCLAIDERRTQPTLVLFDMDRTLCFAVDYYEAIAKSCQAYIAEQCGLGQDDVAARVNQIREELHARCTQMNQVDIAEGFGIDPDELDRVMADRIDPTHFVRPDEEVRDLLARIRETGARVAVLSNNRPKQTRRLLEALGLADLLDGIITAGHGDDRKPALSFFEKALKRFDATPEQTVMVGDSRQYDIEPAAALGMQTILVGSRTNLLAVPSLIAEESPLKRRVANYWADYDRFRRTFLMNAGVSDPGVPGDVVLDALRRVFTSAWSGVSLADHDIAELLDELRECVFEQQQAVGQEPGRAFDTAEVSGLRDVAEQIRHRVRDCRDALWRVYLGTDALWWGAADPEGLLYFVDGFALLSTEELTEMRPCMGNMLPEHQSIVHKVMQRMLTSAIEMADTTVEFERQFDVVFSAELSEKLIQHELQSEIEAQAIGLNKASDDGATTTYRRRFLERQIDLLRDDRRNVFAEKAEEIGNDFCVQLLSRLPESDHVLIADRAMIGTQPFFLRAAAEHCCGVSSGRLKLRLFVGHSGEHHGDREYEFLVRKRAGVDLERIRPIVKHRWHRQQPIKPAFVVNTPWKQLEGLMLGALLACA